MKMKMKYEEKTISKNEVDLMIKQGCMKTIWFDFDKYGLKLFIINHCQTIKGNVVVEVLANKDRRGCVKGLISAGSFDSVKYKNVRYNEIYLTIKDDIILYDTEGDRGIIFCDKKENDIDVTLQKLPEDRECDHGEEGLTIMIQRNIDMAYRYELSNNEIRGIMFSVIDYHERYIEETEGEYRFVLIERSEANPEIIMMDCFYDRIMLLKSGDLFLHSSKTDTAALLKKNVVCVVHLIEAY
jgi:hypothetical protein